MRAAMNVDQAAASGGRSVLSIKQRVVQSLTMAFKVLYRALMLLGRRARLKRPKVAALAGLWDPSSASTTGIPRT
jgi:hypothetical protein